MSTRSESRTGRRLAAWALLAGLVAAPQAFASPPPWAPAHGHRAQRYPYVYYPQRQIYYAPHAGHWYWRDAGRWQHGPYLPRVLASFAVGGINIVLDSELPYYRHDYVVHHYPAPAVHPAVYYVYDTPPPPRQVHHVHHKPPKPRHHHDHHDDD